MSCLITPKGNVYCTGGVRHDAYIRHKSGLTLRTFLESGGVRIKTHYDHIAIEAGHSLTAAQKRRIRYILKGRNFYSMVISINGKYGKLEKFRPIRSI